MLAIRINGAIPTTTSKDVAVSDRGLNYGDGLFETALLKNGEVRFLAAHFARLRQGCERLGITYPNEVQLHDEIKSVCEGHANGVLKVLVTRGAMGRGYRPIEGIPITRIVTLHELPTSTPSATIVVRWCDLRLGRNSRLAGVKHLNRLEQVLAQSEWQDPMIDEGLMLDTEGEAICGTASNVFIVKQGVLLTPDLRYCGVRGVMRGEVLRAAAELGIPSAEEPLWPHDIETASEVFMTNAVRGIRPIRELAQLHWNAAPIAHQLSAALQL